ncbi:MAG: hypothetical protein ACMXYC_01875, partial [Candidatus Woesearchaeota archaeon]
MINLLYAILFFVVFSATLWLLRFLLITPSFPGINWYISSFSTLQHITLVLIVSIILIALIFSIIKKKQYPYTLWLLLTFITSFSFIAHVIYGNYLLLLLATAITLCIATYVHTYTITSLMLLITITIYDPTVGALTAILLLLSGYKTKIELIIAGCIMVLGAFFLPTKTITNPFFEFAIGYMYATLSLCCLSALLLFKIRARYLVGITLLGILTFFLPLAQFFFSLICYLIILQVIITITTKKWQVPWLKTVFIVAIMFAYLLLSTLSYMTILTQDPSPTTITYMHILQEAPAGTIVSNPTYYPYIRHFTQHQVHTNNITF